MRKPTAVPSDLKDPVGKNIRQKGNRDLSAPSSSHRPSHRDIENSKPKFACPFHKRDPKRFNSRDYEHCAMKRFRDMSTLT